MERELIAMEIPKGNEEKVDQKEQEEKPVIKVTISGSGILNNEHSPGNFLN